jgi:hypothetical protein
MNRRAFVFAGLAASAAGTARATAAPQVIYIGGLDCPPCRRWAESYRASWLASPQYQRVTWYEIEPAHLREAYEARHWPEALLPVLGQVPRKSGTPRFLIVADGWIVSNEYGVSRWAKTMVMLKKVLES